MQLLNLRGCHVLVAALLCSYCAAVNAEIVVDPAKTVGPVKPMNAVNNGPIPSRGDQSRGNFAEYKAAKIPFARTHDASFCASYGGEHTVDITAIFPDFSKDADDPAAYDFACTDEYLGTMRAAGTEPFFRLGQKIEHYVKKYGTIPPKDFNKWAVVCEHIIRHYNEGWANGFKWNIRYWEIWNEPDLDKDDSKNKRTWGGTEAQFRDLYRITATHLKKCFPDLKIGGPALAFDEGYGDRFLAAMRADSVPIDFFSWHCYCVRPGDITAKAVRIRELMERYGYGKAESILNEWNYVRGWSDTFVYSVRQIVGVKGAAFTAATMSASQDAPVDMLMYYDARPSAFNGIFDYYTYDLLKTYWAIYAWAKLADCGTQVKASVGDYAGTCVTAAKGRDGKLAIFVCRYTDDDNTVGPQSLTVRLADGSLEGAVAKLVDATHDYGEVPVTIGQDGALTIMLERNAFVLIEK